MCIIGLYIDVKHSITLSVYKHTLCSLLTTHTIPMVKIMSLINVLNNPTLPSPCITPASLRLTPGEDPQRFQPSAKVSSCRDHCECVALQTS